MVGRERFRGAGRGVGELGHVAQALTLAAQSIFGALLEPAGALDELPQLQETPGPTGLCVCELLALPTGRPQLPPGARVLLAAAHLLFAYEGVENLQLEGRPRQTPLLELARHGDQALDESGEVLARYRPAPCVRACAAVGENPAGGHQTVLPGWAKLRDGLEFLLREYVSRKVELGFHIGLLGAGSQVAGVAWRSQEKSDCLGEDRLAGAGLPGHSVQTGAEGEIRLPDEDEVLDAEAAEHALGEHLAVAREERHLGHEREVAGLAAQADGERVAPFELVYLMAVHQDAERRLARPVGDLEIESVRHDDRPRVEGMRGNEGNRHRFEPPHHHGPAVGEVVRCRTRRSAADDPVTRLRSEILPPDLPAELDHAPGLRTRDDEVVDRDVRRARGSNGERAKLDDAVLAGEDSLEGFLELGAVRAREEADAPVFDPEHGRPGPERGPQRPEHRPVAAERHDDVGIVGLRLHNLDPRRVRVGPGPLQGVPDRFGPPVREEGDPAHGLGRAKRLRRGGGRTHGFLSVRATRNRPLLRVGLPTLAPAR